MPSLLSVLVREQIRLVKPLLNRMSIPTARTFQDALGELGAKLVAGRVAFEPVPMDSFEACFALPVDEKDIRRAILYLHGGAYVAGNMKYARGFAGILADKTQQRVLRLIGTVISGFLRFRVKIRFFPRTTTVFAPRTTNPIRIFRQRRLQEV